MAKRSWIVKAARPAKYEVRNVSRCKICGRSRAYHAQVWNMPICFREMASQGRLPGVTKSSW